MDWINDTAETWTYVSATQFKTTGDLTAKYPHGCKVRLKQGGNYKYFYVTALSKDATFTYVTVNAGSDYSLANAAITDNYHSYGETAEGFPGFFNFTPTWTVTSGTAPAVGNGTLQCKFNMFGPLVYFTLGLGVGTTTGVGNGGQWRFTLPVANNGGFPMAIGQSYIVDNGVAAYDGTALADSATTFRPSVLLTSGSYASDNGLTQTVPHSWNNTDALLLWAEYRIDTNVG